MTEGRRQSRGKGSSSEAAHQSPFCSVILDVQAGRRSAKDWWRRAHRRPATEMMVPGSELGQKLLKALRHFVAGQGC